MRAFGCFATAVLTVAGCARLEVPPRLEAPNGQPAPETAGEDLDGVPFRLSDYRGKVVLLDFWGDW
jgi:hypothetical protein